MKTQYEVKVLTIDTISTKGTIIDTSDYPLTRDKVIRYIVPSQRDDYAFLVCYALNVSEGLKN